MSPLVLLSNKKAVNYEMAPKSWTQASNFGGQYN